MEIIKKYEKYLTYWVSEKDKGQSHALNKGIAKASGSILAWLNSDDFYEKDTLSYVSNQFLSKNIDVLCGACCMITNLGEKKYLMSKDINLSSLLRYWEIDFCPPQPSIFFSRRAFQELGKFDENLHYAMDYDLWLTISNKYTFYCTEKLLSYYRVHSTSKTGTSDGFEKFRPEWQKVAHKHLQNAPTIVKTIFYLSKYKNQLPKQTLYYIKRMYSFLKNGK